MNIFIASDHAGFELKATLIESLSEIGHTVVDCGSYAYREGDDYPQFISKAARAVSEAESIRKAEDESFLLTAIPYQDGLNNQNHQVGNPQETRGIVIGGSGTGEAIVANKYPHVRCAICYGGYSALDIVKLSREHNNSNMLSLGARFLAHDEALELVLLWLNTPFTGDERHVRRLHEVDIIEQHKNTPLYE
jgi:ribose 5-phosphate isomerase B